MLRSRLLILLAVVPIAAVSLAAEEAPACYATDFAGTPEDATDDVEACELQTWFHRAQTPMGNVEAQAESYPTFDATPPAGSVAEGNGGGYAGSSYVQIADPGSPNAGAHFVGEFEGVIDRLDVTLHGFYNGFGSTGGPTNRHPHTIDLYLALDGIRVLSGTEVQVATSTVDDPTAQPHQFDFAIDDLAGLMDAYGLELAGTHTVALTIVPKYINTNPAAIYVYDTTEVPGGIVFNPAEPKTDIPVVDAW